MSWLEKAKYHLEPITEGAKALGMPLARLISARDENGIIAPNLLGYMPFSGEFRPPQVVDDVRGLWNKEIAQSSVKFDQQLHDDWGVGYTGSADEGTFDSDRDAAQFAGNFVPVPGAALPQLAPKLAGVTGKLGQIARGAARGVQAAADLPLPVASAGKPLQSMAQSALIGSGLYGVLTGVRKGREMYNEMNPPPPPEPTPDQLMQLFNEFMADGEIAAAEAALDEYFAVQARQK